MIQIPYFHVHLSIMTSENRDVFQTLRDHINQFTSIDQRNFDKIKSYFIPLRTRKKEILFRENDFCDTLYYISEGCLHLYFTDENGLQKTVQFEIENWWITDFLAFHHGSRTEFSLQAIESSNLLSISRIQQDQLVEKHPTMETYFRKIYEIAYGAAMLRTKYNFNFSKEEIYFRFRDQFPEFAQRIPQYLLATFLGLTPEYLSKIRAKKRS